LGITGSPFRRPFCRRFPVSAICGPVHIDPPAPPSPPTHTRPSTLTWPLTSFLAANRLIDWARTFSSYVSEHHAALNILPQWAAELSASFDAFAELYQLAQTPSLRTTGIIEAKNQAKKVMISKVRYTARTAHGSATNQQKIDMGLPVERPGGRRARLPVPPLPPVISVEPLASYKARVRFADLETGSGKPRGCNGAMVFGHVGQSPPMDGAGGGGGAGAGGSGGWKLIGMGSRRTLEVSLEKCAGADGLQPGMQVWVTSCWTNRRGECGPLCAPMFTHLRPGVMLKKAA
jgi:hypothetical protein